MQSQCLLLRENVSSLSSGHHPCFSRPNETAGVTGKAGARPPAETSVCLITQQSEHGSHMQKPSMPGACKVHRDEKVMVPSSRGFSPRPNPGSSRRSRELVSCSVGGARPGGGGTQTVRGELGLEARAHFSKTPGWAAAGGSVQIIRPIIRCFYRHWDHVTSLRLAVSFCYHILPTGGVGKPVSAAKCFRDMGFSPMRLSFPMRNDPSRIPMGPQTNYTRFPTISDEIKWKMKVQGRIKRRRHLILLLTGCWKGSKTAVARQPPSRSELQVGALTVGMTSFVLTCASLAAKVSPDS